MSKFVTIFTEREDQVIQFYVEMGDENLDLSFEKASMFIDKTPKQIKGRWYGTLRYRKQLFVTASGDSNHYNTKNVWRKKPRPDMRVNNKQCRKIIVKNKN